MHNNVECVHVDHMLGEAAYRMRSMDLGWLLVIDGDEVVGAVTDRDIVVRTLADRINPYEVAVNEAMSTPVATCLDTDSVVHAAEIMRYEKVRRLAVVDSRNRCKGVVSLCDIMNCSMADRLGVSLFQSVTRPSPRSRTPRQDQVGHGRKTRGKSGAPPNYSSLPKIVVERSVDSSQPAKLIPSLKIR